MKAKGLFFLLTLGFIMEGQAATYQLDTAHSEVGFKVKHLVVSSVKGRFDKFDASFNFDEKTGTLSDVQAKIDVDTINTNQADRDKHLKNPDFFGAHDEKGNIVEANRWITFKSTKVENKNKKPFKVTGPLTMHGITKDVVLNVTYNGSIKDPSGAQKVGFLATTKINRKDFGLTYNKVLEAGGVAVGEEVEITIEGEAKMVAAAAATEAKK